MPEQGHILIVGGGFGGLRTALTLTKELTRAGLRKDHRITVIDRSAHHVFTPLLYKVAADAEFDLKRAAYPFSELLSEVELLQDDVQAVDLTTGVVKLAGGLELRPAYLVLAPGSETNYFNIAGLEENSLPLKTLEDALLIRERLRSLPKGSRVIIGGGGPTGIELAAEISLRHDAKVTLVEAMPTLLPGFDPRLARLSEKRLRTLGIDILLSSPISSAGPKEISIKEGGTLPYDLLIWTGGVKVPEWVPRLPLKTEAKGRIEVAAGMSCVPLEQKTLALAVYALGDIVCVHDKEGKPMPGVARAAIEQGKVIAKNIVKDMQSSAAPRNTYRPFHYPYVLPLGGRHAVGILGSLVLKGLPAWTFKELIEKNYRLSIMPFMKAFFG